MFSKDARILVVDDSVSTRDLIKQYLSNMGFSKVLESNNGREAILKLDSFSSAGVALDLIIADLNMPQMDGISLLKFVKDDPIYSSIPFLMITADSNVEKVMEAIVVGVADFIVKPFDENLLSQKLEGVWARINKKKK